LAKVFRGEFSMNFLGQRLVDAYYHATRPYRGLWLMHACRAGTAPVMILFYHRVADDRANGWTCSTKLFARQIAWARRRNDVVTLDEAQRRLREGNHRPAVAITFDDGYADNNAFALPLLVREQLPCTYFVATDFAASGRPFPHDVANNRPLRPNTFDDLRRWADAGIEIGAHTRTHADLGALKDESALRDEIVGSRDDLAAELGRPVRYFACPFGLPANMQPAVFTIAREAGFEAVCSAYGAYNFPGDDAFHLRRIHADDDFARFRNWLTVDPRKLKLTNYDPTVPATTPVETRPLVAAH
jgi:peptidoglycan/xylan/chitin deacetylase (PgdA/CDA1 family)